MQRHWVAIGGTAFGATALLALLLATDSTTPVVQPAVHVVLISIAVIVAAGLAVLNLRTFFTSGHARFLALATAFLLFCATYVWHGVYTASGHPFAFLIYGPISRVVFGAALIGFAFRHTVIAERRLPYILASLGAAVLVTIVGFFVHGAIDAWAQTASMERLTATRFAVETVAIVLVATGFVMILRSADSPPALPAVSVALTLLIMQSIYFLTTSAWTNTWWTAHAIGAASTILLAGTVWVDHQRAEATREKQKFWELNALKTEFINTAAHELGTPLTPIRLQIHLLTRLDQGLSDAQARSLTLIDRNVNRLETLVGRIQDGAKSLAGKLELDIQMFDLAAALEDLCDSYRPITDHGSISLDHAGPSSLMVQSDRHRIEQVVTNLLNNGVKYTPPGGTIKVTLLASEEYATIEVTDDGAGMPTALLERLFQPFSKGQDRDRPVKGSGLGLFLSKQIVEILGGTIQAESPGLDRGSKFTFSIPRHLDADFNGD